MRIKRRIHLSESQPRTCSSSTILCSINENLFASKPSYKLTISNHKIKIVASDLAGLRHAITTLGSIHKPCGQQDCTGVQYGHKWQKCLK